MGLCQVVLKNWWVPDQSLLNPRNGHWARGHVSGAELVNSSSSGRGDCCGPVTDWSSTPVQRGWF